MQTDEQIIEEINSLKEQYVAEVGPGGRRAWPISIKTRVFELLRRGHKIRHIANETKISYESIGNWIQYEKKKRGFHAIAVLPEKRSQELATVTVAKNLPKQSVVTVTVTTPDGYLIEGLPAHMVADILRARG